VYKIKKLKSGQDPTKGCRSIIIIIIIPAFTWQDEENQEYSARIDGF
jgi:hypothetical protein